MSQTGRREKYIFTILLLILIAAAGAICIRMSGRGRAMADDGKIHVVASFYPMYIASENIADGIDNITVESLTQPSTGCLHDYQLTPQDLITLSSADLFVINGGGIESFLDTVMENYPDLPIIDTGASFEGKAAAGESAGAGSEEINAHYWMSVGHYEVQVEAIADAFAGASPEDADLIYANLDRYMAELEELEDEQEIVRNLTAGESVITFHEAFEYLAGEIGATCAYSIDMDENTSLSAGEISDLITTVKKDNISLIFAEEKYGTKIADAVSSETGAKVCILDSLVTGDEDKDSYVKGMEENLRVIRKAYGKEMD